MMTSTLVPANPAIKSIHALTGNIAFHAINVARTPIDVGLINADISYPILALDPSINSFQADTSSIYFSSGYPSK